MPDPGDHRSPSAPLQSEFAGDPDMLELIEMFVGELPQRSAALQRAWSQTNLGELQRLAHQLKGASAGYGFPSLGHAAAAGEHTLRSCESDYANVAAADLKKQLDELVSLCQRARL